MTRLGVIGLEHPHASGNHLPTLQRMRDSIAVVAVADPDPALAQPWVDDFGVEYYPCRDALLATAQVDTVLVTSRNSAHAEDACAALLAGKDVVCDKPIAIDQAGTEAILAAVERTGGRFITAYPVRYHPAVRALKVAIENGDLGQLEAIMATNHGCMYEPGTPAWVLDPAHNGGGCLVDHVVHVADVIRWITGLEFATVRAEAISGLRAMAAEDLAVLHGELSDGTLYQIDPSWSRRGRDPMWGDVTFRIVGTKGSAVLDLYNSQRIEIYDQSGATVNYPDHLIGGYIAMYLEHARARDGGPQYTGPDATDGVRTMQLVFAAYESLRTGTRMQVSA